MSQLAAAVTDMRMDFVQGLLRLFTRCGLGTIRAPNFKSGHYPTVAALAFKSFSPQLMRPCKTC